jgi:hypothetical protein
MILQFQLPDKSLHTMKREERSAAGSELNLSDFQRCRELSLFCQSCHEKWEQAIPRTYSVYRMACPHCKTETHGNILTLTDRY